MLRSLDYYLRLIHQRITSCRPTYIGLELLRDEWEFLTKEIAPKIPRGIPATVSIFAELVCDIFRTIKHRTVMVDELSPEKGQKSLEESIMELEILRHLLKVLPKFISPIKRDLEDSVLLKLKRPAQRLISHLSRQREDAFVVEKQMAPQSSCRALVASPLAADPMKLGAWSIESIFRDPESELDEFEDGYMIMFSSRELLDETEAIEITCFPEAMSADIPEGHIRLITNSARNLVDRKAELLSFAHEYLQDMPQEPREGLWPKKFTYQIILC